MRYQRPCGVEKMLPGLLRIPFEGDPVMRLPAVAKTGFSDLGGAL